MADGTVLAGIGIRIGVRLLSCREADFCIARSVGVFTHQRLLATTEFRTATGALDMRVGTYMELALAFPATAVLGVDSIVRAAAVSTVVVAADAANTLTDEILRYTHR